MCVDACLCTCAESGGEVGALLNYLSLLSESGAGLATSKPYYPPEPAFSCCTGVTGVPHILQGCWDLSVGLHAFTVLASWASSLCPLDSPTHFLKRQPKS